MGNGRDASRTVLCVDVGNSDTNLGLFVDGELEATWKVTTTERMTADEARMRMAGLFDMLERDGRRAICDDAVIASVVPGLTDAWVTATRALTGRRPLVVGPGVKTGVKMRYNDPGELGADRVADLVAARTAYTAPFIVVDLGTTTNFEVVDEGGSFVGGIIAPVVKLSAKALSDAAAQLAMVDLKAPASVVGKNTREAMQAGVVMGEVALIDGLIDGMARTGLRDRRHRHGLGCRCHRRAVAARRPYRRASHPAGPEHAAHVEPSLKINQGLQFNPVRVQFPPC